MSPGEFHRHSGTSRAVIQSTLKFDAYERQTEIDSGTQKIDNKFGKRANAVDTALTEVKIIVQNRSEAMGGKWLLNLFPSGIHLEK